LRFDPIPGLAMHEASIAVELLALVEEQARRHALGRVTGLHLRIGAMRAVVPELLQAAFEVVAKGSLAEGAGMRIDSVPLLARCSGCGRQVAVEEFVFLCPGCGAVLDEILSGKELDLLELTGEEGGTP
jgi:hydrogenase nickel incorporation protein HypA/HybF